MSIIKYKRGEAGQPGPQREAELCALAKKTDDEIDYSDIHETFCDNTKKNTPPPPRGVPRHVYLTLPASSAILTTLNTQRGKKGGNNGL